MCLQLNLGVRYALTQSRNHRCPSIRSHGGFNVIAALLTFGCAAGPVTSLQRNDIPRRDNSPIQTDSLVYHLQRLSAEYRAYVVAKYTNKTSSSVYFARCNDKSTTPMYGVRRTGADSSKSLFSDVAWACVGGVPTGEIPRGASVTVRVPLGTVDQPAMQPRLKPEELVGLMRVMLELCRTFSTDSDYCDPVPDTQRSSNPFLVTY